MADAKQPELPEGTPDHIRKFVECTSDKVELKVGNAEWLRLDISPDAKFLQPKGQKEKVDVELTAGGMTLATVPVAVVDGKLSVDTSKWPELLPGKDGVDKWVRDLNDWMASRKKKLGGLTVKAGNVVLTKVALDGAAAGGSDLLKDDAGIKERWYAYRKKLIAGAAA